MLACLASLLAWRAAARTSKRKADHANRTRLQWRFGGECSYLAVGMVGVFSSMGSMSAPDLENSGLAERCQWLVLNVRVDELIVGVLRPAPLKQLTFGCYLN